MAQKKEFSALCPDCHTRFRDTKEEFHRPTIFHGLIIWESEPDSRLQEWSLVFRPDSILAHDLFLHHEKVGQHVLHDKFVLFDRQIESVDDVRIEPGQTYPAERYPDSVGLLYPHGGGGVIFWKEQTDTEKIDLSNYGE